MWLSFLRPRDRFSLGELRYLTDQLRKIQIVNEANKDFVVEALRSIAEILTYGDQHDPSFFEFFMEKQVMGEFVRILRVSKTVTVSVQLLQTMSIMIQNLKIEQAIYYLFSNEYVNYLITYTFDFQHEELLSYYISFLRAVSGKLNKHTISLLLKTENDVVVSFPLYVEGIQFAFHEENMIRTAVRALTLNVYHVGDESVNDYVVSPPHTEYFSKLVSFFQKQCMDLSEMVLNTLKSPSPDSGGKLFSAVDGIEDTLYYFSDVISAGIPDIGRLITDHILQHLTIPLLLPSLYSEAINDISIDPVTSLYLLCCIVRIVKIKDLANMTAATLFCPVKAFISSSLVKPNSSLAPERLKYGNGHPDNGVAEEVDQPCSSTTGSSEYENSHFCSKDTAKSIFNSSNITFRETLLQYISEGDDVQAQGSLFVLATLLQTKELEESMLDAFGILPQRKQHKKLLLQSLVGEDSGEEQLFSPQNGSMRDGFSSELDWCLRRLEEQFGVCCSLPGAAMCSRVHRNQVVDALVSLLCRENISADTLWDGGWLLRQLLPYSEAEFNRKHLKMLNVSYEKCKSALMREIRGTWPDLLITVLLDEWKKCKRVVEAPSPQKEPKSVLLQLDRSSSNDNAVSESSFTEGERLCEVVKVFVLLHQLQIFSLGKPLPEQPPIHPPADRPETPRATIVSLGVSIPKPGTEVKLVNAIICRVAFERGKEREFSFLVLSSGVSGWIVLTDRDHGIVRVSAPLAGCKPRIDEKHRKWLHLRIRPSTLPFLDPTKRGVYEKLKSKGLVDGKWTLAFMSDESCHSACSMVLREIDRQCSEVERRLEPLFDLERNKQDQ
ncbi:Protein TRANSPARENT TESTA 9 [Cardamine amara subsp. amara]|uniref:Protein TRANSPARENT TESTA 9 n=1 Tax=Cardamine amara subsp. amara TaxID=228776 RepID=A0ABD0Z1L3_CARAN